MLLTKAGNPGTPPHYPFYMDSSKEYNHPIDSTIGASYVSLDAKDTTKLNFCYDGNVRVEAYHDNKKVSN